MCFALILYAHQKISCFCPCLLLSFSLCSCFTHFTCIFIFMELSLHLFLVINIRFSSLQCLLLYLFLVPFIRCELVFFDQKNMSYTRPNINMTSGGRTVTRTVEFGRTYVVRPQGEHKVTVVWLHGLGDNGSSSSQLLESLHLPNIKWICPTAPTRPVALLGGFPCTAWFDVGELSENGPDDVEGLDASAAHIEELLSAEPANVKVGMGGFSMGAAAALYSASCCTLGKYGNGSPYSVNLRAVIALSGWLPGSRSLRNKIEGSHEAARRATSLPILLCHGLCDDVVAFKYGETSAQALSSAGFRYLTFKSYEGMGHYTVPKEMAEVCNWLNSRLVLQ